MADAHGDFPTIAPPKDRKCRARPPQDRRHRYCPAPGGRFLDTTPRHAFSRILAQQHGQPKGTDPLRTRPHESRKALMHDVSDGTHWHEPGGETRAGFGTFVRPKTSYDLFMESEGIPIFRDIGVNKVQNLPLGPWSRMGGKGTYIQLHGTEGKWGCYVVEVPGAGALNSEKHLYEEIYLVVDGRGTTEVWLDNDS